MESQREPKLTDTLLNDVKEGDFFRQFKGEWRDLNEFYLSQEKRDELLTKGLVHRWFLKSWWLLRSIILKLTPVRRLLVVIGIILVLAGRATFSLDSSSTSAHYEVVGLVALLIVLTLELKDKLLAHTELQEGRAVQRAMQPEQVPNLPGWDIWLFTRPANEVGGDIVDFLQLGKEQCMIAIGDVAGKGLGAALLMVKIQAILHALAGEDTPLKELMDRVNGILIRDRVPGRFASLVVLRCGSNDEKVEFVNAGHLPPLLIAAGQVQECAKGNPAIGLSADTAFRETSLIVPQGGSLLLYSDGITDARNTSGEFFDAARFKDLCVELQHLPARTFGERIVEELDRFTLGAPVADDLSLAILRRAS